MDTQAGGPCQGPAGKPGRNVCQWTDQSESEPTFLKFEPRLLEASLLLEQETLGRYTARTASDSLVRLPTMWTPYSAYDLMGERLRYIGLSVQLLLWRCVASVSY
jgi:hypothetical protein